MATRPEKVDDLRTFIGGLVSMLEENPDPATANFYRGLLNKFIGSPKKADALRDAVKGPTAIQRRIDDVGGITTGGRSVPLMRNLGAAPRPEFGEEALEVLEASGQKVPATLQMLRNARARLAAPTSADYNYQPQLGFRFPADAPDNIDVIRGANTMRLPDLGNLPDAPARIPQGQLDAPLDFRSNREVMSEQPFMAAPRVSAPGTSAPVPESSSVVTRRSRLGDAIDRGEINLTQSDSSDPFQKLRDMYSRFQKDIGPGEGVPVISTNPIVSASQQTLGLRFPKGARAITEYTTSRGAVRQPGTGLGGQPYNPMAMASPDNIDVIRGANTTRLPDLEDLPDAPARIPQGQTEMFIAPGTIRRKETVDTMRPQGVQLIDFSRLSKQLESMSPVDKAKFLATAGLTPLGVGLLATRGENISENASEPEMFGPTDQAPDAGDGEFGGGSLPPGTGLVTPPADTTLTPEEAAALNQNQEEILTALQQSDPISSAAIRAVAPKSPENYANIGDYYADRAAFVRSLQDGGSFQRIVDAIKADAGANAENLGTFAKANPTLAYEYAVRNQLAPELTQQTGESVATMGVGSALGDNNDASAVGMANAEADNVGAVMGVGGDLERAAAIQKNNEIISATQPIARPNLQRSQDLVQQYLMRRRGF